MLSYQRNTLLALLANFKAKLYNYMEDNFLDCSARDIILRNITSIEKQLKKL